MDGVGFGYELEGVAQVPDGYVHANTNNQPVVLINTVTPVQTAAGPNSCYLLTNGAAALTR